MLINKMFSAGCRFAGYAAASQSEAMLKNAIVY